MDVPPLLRGSIEGSDFTVAEWVDENESSAAQPIAPLHVHHGDDEAWYVLESALGFIRGRRERLKRACRRRACWSAAAAPPTSSNTWSGSRDART